ILQLLVAAVPIILHGEWGIMFITAMGTILALAVGALPQWTAEKLPNNQKSDKIFALTAGNGARDIMIIRGAGRCLDLEELSAAESPRNGRPWTKFAHFTTPRSRSTDEPQTEKTHSQYREPKMLGKFPRGFLITRLVCILQSLCWLLLLVN